MKVLRNGQEVSGDTHAFEFGEQFAPRPALEAAPVAASVAVNDASAKVVASGRASKVKETQPLSAQQVIKDLKARLRHVEREIKARKALEAERDQIQRLLKAAKQEKATVHALKRATAS